MSWKETCVLVSPGHYVLPRTKAMRCDVDLFLSDLLMWGDGPYSPGVEEAVFAQYVHAASFPGVTRVVGLPDTHVGYGVPIGCVIETEGVLLPTAAGYDIGCGMAMLETTLKPWDVAGPEKRERWVRLVGASVGLGVGAGGKHRAPHEIRDVLRYGAQAFGLQRGGQSECDYLDVGLADPCLPAAAAAKIHQLGSLGGGNHFMELEVGSDNRVYVMVHTGSRGFGYQIAKKTFVEASDRLGLSRMDEDSVWMDACTTHGREYLALHNMAGNFAIANRVMITRQVARATEEVFGGTATLLYEISHNLIQEEAGKFVARKGATRAFPAGHPDLLGTPWAATGHPILTPGSMRDGSAILYAAPGAAASAYSINHGSGRRLARGVARRTLYQGEVDLEMKDLDIVMNTAKTPLDESGDAYKPLDDVIASVEQAGLARLSVRLRPRAVVKGSD